MGHTCDYPELVMRMNFTAEKKDNWEAAHAANMPQPLPRL